MSREADRRSGRRRWRLLLAAAAWAALVALWAVYRHRTGEGSLDAAQRLVDGARGNWWAIVAYVVVSLLRPLVLFPATVVTVAAGMLFGPVVGVVVAAVAANASALIGYTIGWRLGRAGETGLATNRLEGWTERLRRNGFEAVLLMRLLFLPYDLVNYGCGLLRVGRGAFLSATAVGTLPGTVAFVLVGASATRLDDGLGGIDRTTLGVSIGLIVASLVTARLVRRSAPSSR